jgi:hypothetical protein
MLKRVWATDLPVEDKSLVADAINRKRSGEIERGIQTVASLAGVDGAIVMTRDLQFLGFGATIAVAAGRNRTQEPRRGRYLHRLRRRPESFPEAIEAAFPKTAVQLCIVHVVRHSLTSCSKQRQQVAPSSS